MSKPTGHQGKFISEYKIFWPLEDLEGKELIDNANLTDAKYGFASPSAQLKVVDKEWQDNRSHSGQARQRADICKDKLWDNRL